MENIIVVKRGYAGKDVVNMIKTGGIKTDSGKNTIIPVKKICKA